ncbi:hypothetical protein [Desulfovibrio gilichinskyi]|uniref:Uncharacterized protein, PEP-CTERM system associated n=1 Tax=Desulfovibrio gilichinskyi TaxID=1519643 RepID=A0A1X7C668_9BACT|nr:hypothetical protein [Desulfovibrio gilichinskyi]SME90672.1 uncharacterized protein, PEP-CTERM system associated [Desulfovibrio gilichinskyi]
MINFVRQVIRVLGISILLIPVCCVLADQYGSSWRVRMPVIQPLEVVAKSSDYKHISDFKRPVSHAVLRTESLDYVVDDGPLYRVAFYKEKVKKDSTGSANGYSQVAQADAAVEGKKESTYNAENDTSAENKAAFSTGISENPLVAPSVSILPNGNAAVKQQRIAQDVSFYTTPKRALGLSGTVIKVKPSVTVVETYDSNVDYAKISDFVTRIKPALTLDIIGQDSLVKFRGDFIYRTYLEHDELNRYDYNLNLSGKYRFSPKLDASLDLMHNRRHNLDQNTYDSGGVELDPSIILTTTATPQLNWRVSEKDNLNVVFNIDKTDYERKADSDYLSNVLNLVWGHALDDELTTFFLGAMTTYTHYSREIDNLDGDQVTFQNVIGVDHQFTPALKLSLKGGPGVTISNYSNDAGHDDGTAIMYQFRAELGYREPTFSIVPALERVVRPGRYGENEILDQFELYYRYLFSETLNYNIVNTLWQIDADGVQGGRKHKSTGFFTQSVFTWEFKEDWKATCGLSYNFGQNEISHKTNDRFKSWIGFTYSFPTEIN